MIVLATLFGLSICCIAAYTGLAMKDEESVQAFGMIWLFPITFLSSAFVPIPTMPGWLQAFAYNQPVTYVDRHDARVGAGRPDRGESLEERGLDRRRSSSCSRRWRCAPTRTPTEATLAPALLNRGAQLRGRIGAAPPAGNRLRGRNPHHVVRTAE